MQMGELSELHCDWSKFDNLTFSLVNFVENREIIVI